MKGYIMRHEAARVLERGLHPVHMFGQCRRMFCLAIARRAFGGIDLDRSTQLQDVMNHHLLCANGVAQQLNNSGIGDLCDPRRAAIGGLDNSRCLEGLVRFAHNSCADAEVGTGLQFRRNRFSRLQLMCLNLIDDVLGDALRQSCGDCLGAWHADSIYRPASALAAASEA